MKEIKISEGITQYILDDSDIKNNKNADKKEDMWLIDGIQRQMENIK